MTGISKLPELFYDTLARMEHKFLYLGQAGHRDIVFDIPMRLLGFPQTPDCPLRVPSNTPDGVALPLPSVAPSRTSAQEIRGALRADQRSQCCAGFVIHTWVGNLQYCANFHLYRIFILSEFVTTVKKASAVFERGPAPCQQVRYALPEKSALSPQTG